MGESSTCLVRSFSTPADTSCVPQEDDPVRALGESISFGRFLSESLDWERWSVFSHKRYVEEAEKYSKPGSVAAKKAYFEAHYKKKAAERAAALEANAETNKTSESEVPEENSADSSVEMNSDADNIVIANEQPHNETVSCRVVECADTNQHKCDAGQSESEISYGEVAQDSSHPHVDMNLSLESLNCVDNSGKLDHVDEVHKNIAMPLEDSKRDHGTAGQEASASTVTGTEVNSSPKLSAKARAAGLPHSLDERKAAPALPPRSGIHGGSKGKKSVGDLVEKKRSTLHMSINLSSGSGVTSKKVAAASQSRNGLNSFSTNKRPTASSLYMSVNLPSETGLTSKRPNSAAKPRNGISFAAEGTKSVGDVVEKRPNVRSLHMSGAGEASKTTSTIEKNRTKTFHSVGLQTSTKASHALLNQTSANPSSQGRRSERLLNKSVRGGVTANARLSSSISVDCLRSSSTTKSNSLSATISLPFRLRSEERAMKRKELLQRMEETKSKEEEKVNLPRIPKGKTDPDHKKLRQSSGSISKLNEDRPDGLQSSSNLCRKITVPRSPKLGKKASSSTVQDRNLGNSWKPPIYSNTSKRTTEKNNQATKQSVTSLSNTSGENASPNIQH